MLLIYTSKITPRLKFVFKQICTRILNIPVSFTSVIEEFIAHDSLKISYGPQPLGSEFFVKSNGLLFEQGLSDLELNVQGWGDTKCFFSCGEKSQIPFDIFSASFAKELRGFSINASRSSPIQKIISASSSSFACEGFKTKL